MSAPTINSARRAGRNALAIGLLALVAAAVLGMRDPAGWTSAYRFAAFACLAPAIGSLIFVLIYRLTGGQWAETLTPFLSAGVALLPWIWLLTLPLLWIAPERFAPPPESTGLLRAYFSHGFVVVRSLIYAAMFFLYGIGVRRVLQASSRNTMRWFGPVGLIVLTFMLHLLTVDWFVALEPGWYSTGFGFVWMTAQAIAGLALAVGTALLLGVNPAAGGSAQRPRGIDWGNLLLTSVLSWTYVAFLEFLIIWSGNLPREIAWYVRRGHGGWRVVVILLALLQFGAPFLLLLSRQVKQRTIWLGAISALLVLGQIGYTAWLILPAFPSAGGPRLALDVLVALAAVALVWNRYLAAVRLPSPAAEALQ
jgi:hypothetical protein